MGDQFELSILDTGAANRVVVVARRDFDTAVATLSLAALKALAEFRDLLAETASGQALNRPTPDDLKNFGRSLFDLLVQGDIKTVYDKVASTDHIRLQIFSNHAALQSLPWEYVQDPKAAPGPNNFRSIVRLVPTIGVDPPRRRPIGGGLRMLFAYAEPADVQSVGWVQVKGTIEHVFKTRITSKKFSLNVVEGASRQSLLDEFQNAPQPYDVLHLVCHGKVLPSGEGVIVLQDIKGTTSEDMLASEFATLLRGRKLRLVVLSACNTATGSFAREYAVIAKTLVENGIPAVVANQFEIQSEKAALFTSGFYAELIKTGDVDRATTEGRVALSVGTQPLPGAASIDWGIPTLYRHLGGARTF